MTIHLDRAKAYLRPSQLQELVLAVIGADEHDEDSAIEWKSTLNFSEPKAIVHHVARQIIGFANRLPESAAKLYGGHGYIIIGVAPDCVQGVAPIDPAHLVQKISPYVGSQLSWTPEFVILNGVRILVIIIDPPRFGDPIHSLQKRFEQWNPETVFVRRHGNTELADPIDLNRLAARTHLAQARADLEVSTARPIEAWPDRSFLDHCQQEILWDLHDDLGLSSRDSMAQALFRDSEVIGFARMLWSILRAPETSLALRVRNRSSNPAKDVRIRVRCQRAFMPGERWIRSVLKPSPPAWPALDEYRGQVPIRLQTSRADEFPPLHE